MCVSRPARPRAVAAGTHVENPRFNHGRDVARVRQRSFYGIVSGAVLGLFASAGLHAASLLVGGPALIAGVTAGTVFGWWRWCRPFYTCSEGACLRLIPASAKKCPGCGGTVSETITLADLHARWKKMREDEDARDEQIDPSEFAGDVDSESRLRIQSPRSGVGSRRCNDQAHPRCPMVGRSVSAETASRL